MSQFNVKKWYATSTVKPVRIHNSFSGGIYFFIVEIIEFYSIAFISDILS